MYYAAEARATIVLLDVTEGTTLKQMETACDVTISPVASATIVLKQESNISLAFEGVYGNLPDGILIIGVKNAYGAFPDDASKVTVRVILDPYQVSEFPTVLDATFVALTEGCPLCGTLDESVEYEVDDIEDEDEEGFEGDEEPDDDDDGSPEFGCSTDTPDIGVT